VHVNSQIHLCVFNNLNHIGISHVASSCILVPNNFLLLQSESLTENWRSIDQRFTPRRAGDSLVEVVKVRVEGGRTDRSGQSKVTPVQNPESLAVAERTGWSANCLLGDCDTRLGTGGAVQGDSRCNKWAISRSVSESSGFAVVCQPSLKNARERRVRLISDFRICFLR
jgi:hypothetical protein